MNKNTTILTELRNELDTIDRALLELLAKRSMLVRKIGEYKKHHQLPALDAKRWEAIMKNRHIIAKQLGIPSDTVGQIWKCIHDWSLRIESEI